MKNKAIAGGVAAVLISVVGIRSFNGEAFVDQQTGIVLNLERSEYERINRLYTFIDISLWTGDFDPNSKVEFTDSKGKKSTITVQEMLGIIRRFFQHSVKTLDSQ